MPVPAARARDDRRHPLRLGNAFADHRTFELGENAEHLEHGTAGRRRGVEALLMREQIDTLGVKLAQEVQQVDQRAAQAIDRPGCDHVDVAAGNGLEQPIEPRALVATLGAGYGGVDRRRDGAPRRPTEAG